MREEFGEDFWGFWMLGGMSGGGMGFIFDPHRKAEAQKRLQEIMSQTKRELEHALPFAMEPVVYDFAINERGTWADLLHGDDALLPRGYYALHVPRWLRADPQALDRTAARGTGQVQRRLPRASGICRHDANAVRPSAAALENAKAASSKASPNCSNKTASTACSTSRFATI